MKYHQLTMNFEPEPEKSPREILEITGNEKKMSVLLFTRSAIPWFGAYVWNRIEKDGIYTRVMILLNDECLDLGDSIVYRKKGT